MINQKRLKDGSTEYFEALVSKRKIKESYEVLGGRIYDIRYAEEQNSKFNAALEKVKPNSPDITLDSGCGTGLFLTKVESTIIGVDLAQRLLDKAADRTRGFSNVHLVCADAEYLPFRNSSFDKIYSFTVVHNLSNPEKGVNEMIRVSRLDANVIISGLKKAFTLNSFVELFNGTGLHVELENKESLKDFLVFMKRKV